MLAQLGQGGICELRTRSSWLAVRSVTRGIPELFRFQAEAWKSSLVLKQEDPLLPFLQLSEFALLEPVSKSEVLFCLLQVCVGCSYANNVNADTSGMVCGAAT